MTLKDYLNKAATDGWATGHFNASELDQMRAIVEASAELVSPAIVGMSEGERNHIGLREAVVLREIFEKEYNIPVFLNADHSKSVVAAEKAIDAGFNSIHIDLSSKSFDENAAGTKEIVRFAKSRNPEISVEGELGYLKGESKVHKIKIEVDPEDYTKPEEAVKFVAATGVDRLAIVVGNIHGISPAEPRLDIERIKNIFSALKSANLDVNLVLHAGSGIPDDQISAAIAAGISNIHINTDIRIAYVEAFKKSFAENADEVAMYKIDVTAMEAMKNVVKAKLELFHSVSIL